MPLLDERSKRGVFSGVRRAASMKAGRKER
jgi:hypothetical protein